MKIFKLKMVFVKNNWNSSLTSPSVVGRCVPKIFSDVIDTSTKMVDSDSNTTLERANGDGVTVKDIKEGTM